MNQFEELAHGAARSARATVSHIAIPPTPYRSATRRSVRAGLVIAATTAVIIGFIVATNGGSTPVDVAANSATTPAGDLGDEPGVYLEFDVPDGWTVEVSEGTNDPSRGAIVTAALAYGAGTSDDPFADADLTISMSKVPPGSYMNDTTPPSTLVANSELATPAGATPTTLVRGHEADAGVIEAGRFNTLNWQERDDLLVGLSSNHYGSDELIKMADRLSVADFVVSLSNPPDGMSLIASHGVTETGDLQNSDLWNMYAVNDGSGSQMSLAASSPQLGYLRLIRHMNPNSVDVAIRGTTGVLEVYISDQNYQEAAVSWIENGQAMSLSVFGSGDPVAIANSLRRIDRSRFDELLAPNPMPVNSPSTVAPTPQVPLTTSTAAP